MKIELSDQELELIHAIFAKHLANIEVWAFGSRVKKDSETYSDLDLVLKGKGKIPLSMLSELTEQLENSPLPFKVDLVDWHRITPEFQKQIMKNWMQLL